MPRSHFHLRTGDGLERDQDGIDALDLEAADLEACRAIPPLADELMDGGVNPLACTFEIADATGTALMEVPFGERLRDGPRRAPRRPDRADAPPAPFGGGSSPAAMEMRADRRRPGDVRGDAGGGGDHEPPAVRDPTPATARRATPFSQGQAGRAAAS